MKKSTLLVCIAAVALLAAGSLTAAQSIPLSRVLLPADLGTQLYERSKLTEPQVGPVFAIPTSSNNESSPLGVGAGAAGGNTMGLGSVSAGGLGRNAAGGNLLSGGRSSDGMGLKTIDSAERRMKQLITALEAD